MILHLLLSLITLVPTSDTATIVFAGDAMQHQRQLDSSRKSNGAYDYSGYCDSITDYVSSADYAVINLETPIAKSKHSGYPNFNAPTEFVEELAKTGFDMFLTANNHALDRGDKGLRQTIDRLDTLKLDHLGTYHNPKHRKECLPIIRDIRSFKIGFLNYTYGTNGISPTSNAVVDYINRAKIAADIKATREAGAELICVCIHWGEEHKLLPNNAQKSLADYLINQGADIIIGSHPHVIQPIELKTNPNTGRNTLLVYSLGNFVSNMTQANTRGGLMVRATLSRDENGVAYVALADYRLIFTLHPNGKADNYKVIPIDEETDIDKSTGSQSIKCHSFTSTALQILNKYNINVTRKK